MRQVSLRRFRDGIADLREPVEVSLRDGDGHIRVLGYWTPYRPPVPEDHPKVVLDIPVEADPATFRVIRSPGDVATAVRPDPVRSVPKPSQRKRR